MTPAPIETERNANEPASYTVTVHMRASPTGVAARRQQGVLERLRALEADGLVPGLSVERWGSRVSVPDDEMTLDDRESVALYDEFAAVEDEEGIQLEPFFEQRRAVGGLLSSGPATERVVVFPVVAITVRRDGDLTGLYPCWKDGKHQSVENCLGALADGGTGENLT
jgi:hypothetical protein